MIRVKSKSGKYIALLSDGFVGGFSVIVTGCGVDSFTSQWPCSGFRGEGPVRFDFDSSGNLLDIPYGDREARNCDAGPAQLALCEDAEEFGAACIARRRCTAEVK